MNTTQLEKAKKEYGFSMEITLEGNKLFVANAGYITDDPSEVKTGKHFGTYGGFHYKVNRKGYLNNIIDVIRAISSEQAVIV